MEAIPRFAGWRVIDEGGSAAVRVAGNARPLIVCDCTADSAGEAELRLTEACMEALLMPRLLDQLTPTGVVAAVTVDVIDKLAAGFMVENTEPAVEGNC